MRGFEGVVAVLLAAGADASLASAEFGTPLAVATAEGKHGVAKLLTAAAAK
jgi:hypothetical protein